MQDFLWDSPFRLDDQLSESERLIRDTAQDYSQGRLQPRSGLSRRALSSRDHERNGRVGPARSDDP